jgi:DNA-binding transcriptional LysR family regulator
MNSIDWDDLRFFLALARAGSLSAAARVLDVEHSTVARRLTRLEKSMDCRLFDRMARGWTLTADGIELKARASVLETDILLIGRAAFKGASLAGPVRISAPPALLSRFIVPLLGEIIRDHPDIKLHCVAEIREADLGRGEADIALRMVDPVGAELVTRVVGQVAYGLYGTEKWLETSQSERQFIGFLPSEKFWLATQLAEHVGDRRYALRTNDIHSIMSAAAHGHGVALLPRFLADDDPRLSRLGGLDASIRCPVFLVMQRDVRQSPRIRLVADFLARKLGDLVEWQ